MEKEIKEAVEKYNTYTDGSRMKVILSGDYAKLYIGKVLITEDFDFSVLERIELINHENGLDYF